MNILSTLVCKSPHQMVFGCSLHHDATGQRRSGIMRITLDANDQIIDEEMVMEYGQPLPGVPGAVYQEATRFSVGPDGKVIAFVHTNQPGGVLWYDGRVVMALNDPSSIPGRTIEDIWQSDVNSSGDWIANVELDGNEPAVVKNGLVQWRGAQPPFEPGGPYTIAHLQRPWIAEDGRVFVVATPSTATGYNPPWLVVDGHPLYVPWRDRWNGLLVGHFQPLTNRWVDPEGAFATFYVNVGDGSTFTPGTMVMPLVRSQLVCDGPLRASGDDPTIEYLGSTRVQSSHRHLVGRGLPAHAPVIWLSSAVPASVPLPGAGQGTVCVGAPIARLAATADARGDVLAPATFFGSPGRTYYQLWYRDPDPSGGPPTARVSDAVVVDLR